MVVVIAGERLTTVLGFGSIPSRVADIGSSPQPEIDSAIASAIPQRHVRWNHADAEARGSLWTDGRESW